MPFLNDLLDQTKESESPKSFIYWAGLCAIAAVVRKEIYLDKFLYKLYPNIYVMLVAPSGGRKGFPVNLCKQLVQETKVTRVISGRNSIQAIVSDLSKGYTVEGSKMLVSGAHGLLCAPELATFLVSDDAATSILTDLYDTHSNVTWRNTLKSGVEELKDVCLNMISGTNEKLFKEVIPEFAYYGGFMGRTLVVKEEKRSKKNALTEKPVVDFDQKGLVAYLKILSQLKGEFKWEDKAKAAYRNWYEKFDPESIEDTTGTAERIHDQVLKVAMLLALSELPALILTEKAILAAIDTCLALFGNTKSITAGAGKHDLAAGTKAVLEDLVKDPTHSMDRQRLLARNYGIFDAASLDKIIDTLTQCNYVTLHSTNKGPKYHLSDEFLAQYNKFKQVS